MKQTIFCNQLKWMSEQFYKNWYSIMFKERTEKKQIIPHEILRSNKHNLVTSHKIVCDRLIYDQPKNELNMT